MTQTHSDGFEEKKTLEQLIDSRVDQYRPVTKEFRNAVISALSDRLFVAPKAIGEGGYGAVFYAVHCNTTNEYAIKIIDFEVLNSKAGRAHALEQFIAEANAQNTAAQNNEGVAKCYEIQPLCNESGKCVGVAMIMDYIDGSNLSDWAQKKLPSERLRIFRSLVDTVIRSQGNGIIHRDLKPENVFVQYDGGKQIRSKIKLIDFGISSIPEGVLACSPYYAAPEQLSGSFHSKTDVYALGKILHELFAREVPHQKRVDELWVQARNQDYTPFTTGLIEEMQKPLEQIPYTGVRELDDAIHEAVSRCLEFGIDKRGSLNDLWHAMDSAITIAEKAEGEGARFDELYGKQVNYTASKVRCMLPRKISGQEIRDSHLWSGTRQDGLSGLLKVKKNDGLVVKILRIVSGPNGKPLRDDGDTSDYHVPLQSHLYNGDIRVAQ